MNKKVFLKHQVSGSLLNAFSVKLSSEDESYGIKRKSDGQVIVPDDTSVFNPTTGYYEYEFSTDPGYIYEVSWEVEAQQGDAPAYAVQEIGPFENQSDTGRRVIVKQKGKHGRGSWAALSLELFNDKGEPFSGVDVTVSISKEGETTRLVDEEVPLKLKKNLYLFDWNIPGNADLGKYVATWRYEHRGEEHIQQQIFDVSDIPDTSIHYMLLPIYRLKLSTMIQAIQAIPVYMLQARESHDNKTFDFGVSNWNPSSGVRVFLNQELQSGGYSVDFESGCITFDNELLPEDQVHADFVFRCFEDEDLDMFLMNGVNQFNIFPPHTNMTFNGIPDKYAPPVFYGAAVDAIRTFMMKLMMPETRAFFENSGRADSAFDQMETLKKNYEETWKTLCEQKKFGPYRGLTRSIAQPMYTLPGGRARFFRYLFGSGT
jgi:hypothetical protein